MLDLAALLLELGRDLGEHLAMLGLLADERRALGAARALDRGDLGVSPAGSLLEILQPREVRAQLADHLRLRARYVAVVMEPAGDPSGLVSREQQLHAALLAVEVAQGE